jgi:hypothetical protein
MSQSQDFYGTPTTSNNNNNNYDAISSTWHGESGSTQNTQVILG